MRNLDLLNEFRQLIPQFHHEAEAASSMQHYDFHLVCRIGYLWTAANALWMATLTQSNFPGIDLAEDSETPKFNYGNYI